MALPVTIPNTFANATSSIPLSQLDTNFSTLANAVNGLNSGSETLANLKATTANVGVLTVTGNATIGDASTDTVTLNSTLTANTAVIFAAGTSAAPSITTTGDTNTGIFFPAADTIAFAEGGAEAMRIDSSGNVLVNSTGASGAGKFHINAANGTSVNEYSGLTISNTDDQTKAVRIAYNTANDVGVIAASDTGTAWKSLALNPDGGNVGIGTSSPAEKLDIAGLYIQAGDTRTNNTNKLFGLRMPHYANATTAVNLIGAVSTSTNNAIYIGGNDTSIGGTASTVIAFYTAGNNTTSSGTERARITSGGYFKASNSGTYIGSASSYHELRQTTTANYIAYTTNTSADPLGLVIEFNGASPNGTANRFLYMGDATTMRAEFRSNGGLANYSANNVNLASDQRLKKDISPLDTSWDKVKAIEIVNFRYKDCNEGDPLLYGVIAQQVQPIVPELVVVTQEAKDAIEAKEAVLDEEGNVVKPAVAAKEATPEYFGIREQPMYWLAIKALQEAMTRIEALEAEVAAMKAGNGN